MAFRTYSLETGDEISLAKPEPSASSGGNRFTDFFGVDAARSVVNAGQSLAGVVDLLSFGAVGKGLAAIGYDPQRTHEYLSSFYSDARKQANEKVENAKGFVDTAFTAIENPSTILGAIIQSSVGTATIGAVGYRVADRTYNLAKAAVLARNPGAVKEAAEAGAAAVQAAMPKILGVASATEGAQAAGSIAQQARSEGKEWADFVLPSVGGGTGTALISRVSGGIANRLGAGNIETALATAGTGGTGSRVTGGLVGRAMKGGVSEGAEEAAQSYQEQIFTNVATDKPLTQGAAESAAMGALTGAAMGGGNAALARPSPVQEPAGDAVQRIAAAPTVDAAIRSAAAAVDDVSPLPAGAPTMAMIPTVPEAAPPTDIGEPVGFVGRAMAPPSVETIAAPTDALQAAAEGLATEQTWLTPGVSLAMGELSERTPTTRPQFTGTDQAVQDEQRKQAEIDAAYAQRQDLRQIEERTKAAEVEALASLLQDENLARDVARAEAAGATEPTMSAMQTAMLRARLEKDQREAAASEPKAKPYTIRRPAPAPAQDLPAPAPIGPAEDMQRILVAAQKPPFARSADDISVMRAYPDLAAALDAPGFQRTAEQTALVRRAEAMVPKAAGAADRLTEPARTAAADTGMTVGVSGAPNAPAAVSVARSGISDRPAAGQASPTAATRSATQASPEMGAAPRTADAPARASSSAANAPATESEAMTMARQSLEASRAVAESVRELAEAMRSTRPGDTATNAPASRRDRADNTEIPAEDRGSNDPTARARPARESAEPATSTVESVRTELGIRNASRVRVVQSVEDLPADLQSFVRDSGAAADVQGIERGGAVYLVADNIAPGRAFAVLMHELGVHGGLRRYLGAEDFAALAGHVKVWSKMRTSSDAAKLARAAAERTRSETRPGLRDEELVAHFVEEAVAAGYGDPSPAEQGPLQRWFARLWSAVRSALRKLRVTPTELTTDDVVNLARGALERALGAEDGAQAFTSGIGNERETAIDTDARPRLSRAATLADAITDPFGDRTPLFRKATDIVSDMFRTGRGFNVWARTVGTQLHKAIINPDFRRAFDAGQDFLQDTSAYANAAADLAPDLLPRIDRLADLKRSAPAKTDTAAAANALMEGTLYGGGSPFEGVVWTDDELRGKESFGRPLPESMRGKSMTPAQIKLYRQALAAVGQSLDDVGKSLIHRNVKRYGIEIDRGMSIEDAAESARQRIDEQIDEQRLRLQTARDDRAKSKDVERIEGRITDLEAVRDEVTDIEQKTASLKERGYFPAMRFGRYAISVYRPDSNGTPKLDEFRLFETPFARNRAAREMQSMPEYKGAEIAVAIIPMETHRLYQGLSLDAVEAFAQHVRDDNGRAIGADPVMQEFLRVATNQRSTLKRHIHRKGMAGYTEDMPRALASFVLSSARQSSATVHFPRMLEEVQKMRERGAPGDVVDEAAKLTDYLRNPQESGAWIRGAMFTMFLGGSISAAAINATQPVTVTAPWLTQYTTARDAASKVSQAARDFLRRGSLTGDIKDALERAQAQGVVSPQELHQLRADAEGGGLGGDLRVRKAAFLWGSLFGLAEQFNRGTSFIAAYRVAAANKSLGDPYEFAVRAVRETQFVYNAGARPNWARGAIGATLFTFKTFSISYVELATRLFRTNKVAFSVLMLVLFAMAGAEGLPFAEDIEDILDTIGQWTGKPWNSKRALREWAEETLGKEAGQFFLRGITGIPGVPVDLSGRFSLGNLLPATAALKPSEKDKGRAAMEILGPAGQFLPIEGTKLGDALRKAAQGKTGGAIDSIAPVAVANLLKGIEMAATGAYRDGEGRKVMETSDLEAAAKAIGIQPQRVAAQGRRMREINQDAQYVRLREDAIADRWARAVVDGDSAEVAAARQELRDWNTENPTLRINITSAQIYRRVRALRQSRDQRFEKSLPREMRSQARAALQ